MRLLAKSLNAHRSILNSSLPIRLFSSCAGKEAQWGFIGLGAMGMYGLLGAILRVNALHRVSYGEESAGKDPKS